VLFIPKIIGAVLVLAGGLLVGHFLSEIVQNAAAANEIRGGVALSKIARLVVMVFATIMALEQIGLDTAIVASSVQIIMGTIGLGLAIAFGLGGRDAAAEIVKNFTRSRTGGSDQR
jgi:small-conductance mechanosensitive channel